MGFTQKLKLRIPSGNPRLFNNRVVHISYSSNIFSNLAGSFPYISAYSLYKLLHTTKGNRPFVASHNGTISVAPNFLRYISVFLTFLFLYSGREKSKPRSSQYSDKKSESKTLPVNNRDSLHKHSSFRELLGY